MVASDNFVSYKGAFQIVKTNSADQPLAGAVFELYDHNKQSLGLQQRVAKMAKLSLETWRQVPIITKKSKHQNYQMAQIILFILN